MIVFTELIEEHEDLNPESQHDESQGLREEEKCNNKKQDALYLALSKMLE